MTDEGPGMGLTQRTIVVAGATGGIGEGAVRALLAAGARVLAVGRSRTRLESLATRFGDGDLVLLEADVSAPDSAAVASRLQEAAGGRFAGALISIGSTPPQLPGTVLDIPDEVAVAAIEQNELAGLRALRAIVPGVHPDGAVVNLLGFSAEIPFPGNPLMGSTNAAMRSVLTTLVVQLGGSPRIYGLLLGVVRTRARRAAGIDDPRWLTGEQVGDAAASLIAGRVDHPEQPIRYLLDPRTGLALTPPRR